MLNDYIVSLIRTAVPGFVAWLLSLAADRLGLVGIDSTAAAGLAVSVALAAYYAVVRAAEARWPRVGWLLGISRTPAYDTEATA
ncbi:MAG: hypothetical protein AAGA37_19745 [Actinomycetota bacterium]